MKTKKEINQINEAVFLIDMNVGFCEEGALADPTIKRIVPSIISIIRMTLEKGEGFFVVNDKHTKESTELKRYAGHGNNEIESRTIKELGIYEEYANKALQQSLFRSLIVGSLAVLMLIVVMVTSLFNYTLFAIVLSLGFVASLFTTFFVVPKAWIFIEDRCAIFIHNKSHKTKKKPRNDEIEEQVFIGIND